MNKITDISKFRRHSENRPTATGIKWEKQNQALIEELNTWMSDYLRDFSINIINDVGIGAQVLPGFDLNTLNTEIDMSKSALYLDIYECLPIVYSGLVPVRDDFNEKLVAWANLIEDETPSSLTIAEKMPTVWHVYQSINARWDLEFEETVMLEHVARLGGVDVRTVRNAASKDELDTIREPNRGICIYSHQAKAWLAERKGFIPTSWEEPEGKSDIDIQKIELLNYIEKMSAAAGFKSMATLCTSLGWKPDVLNIRSFLNYDGECPFSLENTAVLAEYLKLEKHEFTIQVMESFYPETLYILKTKNTENK